MHTQDEFWHPDNANYVPRVHFYDGHTKQLLNISATNTNGHLYYYSQLDDVRAQTISCLPRQRRQAQPVLSSDARGLCWQLIKSMKRAKKMVKKMRQEEKEAAGKGSMDNAEL